MARNQVLHSLYSYNERVRKNAIGGKKTQLKNEFASLGASEEVITAFFASAAWRKYEENGLEPEGGWKLKEYVLNKGDSD